MVVLGSNGNQTLGLVGGAQSSPTPEKGGRRSVAPFAKMAIGLWPLLQLPFRFWCIICAIYRMTLRTSVTWTWWVQSEDARLFAQRVKGVGPFMISWWVNKWVNEKACTTSENMEWKRYQTLIAKTSSREQSNEVFCKCES